MIRAQRAKSLLEGKETKQKIVEELDEKDILRRQRMESQVVRATVKSIYQSNAQPMLLWNRNLRL